MRANHNLSRYLLFVYYFAITVEGEYDDGFDKIIERIRTSIKSETRTEIKFIDAIQ